MWVFLNNSFLSIVAYRSSDNLLLVRSRVKGDIEKTFDGWVSPSEVISTPSADYAYRAVVSRRIVTAVIGDMIAEIRYDNFKNSVKEDDRHDAYLGVWRIMNRFQDSRREQELRERILCDKPPTDDLKEVAQPFFLNEEHTTHVTKAQVRRERKEARNSINALRSALEELDKKKVRSALEELDKKKAKKKKLRSKKRLTK